MDNPQRPEDSYTDPGRYVPDTDAIKEADIQTAINDVQYLMELESNGFSNPGCQEPAVVDTYESEIQTALNNLQYLFEKESHGNASEFTFDGSADAREDASSTRLGSDNICSSLNSQSLHFSLSVDDARGFNTYQNHSDPYGMAMNSFEPTHCWNDSASNDTFMNETYPDYTKTTPKIWGISDDNLSNNYQNHTDYYKTLGLMPSSHIAFYNSSVAGIEGQYTESHDNLFQIARSDNELCHIYDCVASNSLSYADGNFAASGSFGCHKDENTLKVVGEKIQFSKKGDIKCINKDIKAVICRICEDERSQHKTKVNISQFDSLYYNREGTDLRIHRSFHVSKTTCNICGKEHAVGNLHQSEHRCPDPECMKRFPCRTLFYQHIPEHRNYFYKHCWVCIRSFKEHITEHDSTTYVCCICGFSTRYWRYLRNHYLLHLPKCFCKICKKEYPLDEKNLHCSEVKCIVCNDVFKCRVQLREHFEAHVIYFSEYCRIRECNIKYPLFQSPFDNSFYTSKDLFQFHLYSHAGLIFLKCETCGRRFTMLKSFNGHTSKCKALPYKCEICEIRFFSIDLLHSHGLVKHLAYLE